MSQLKIIMGLKGSGKTKHFIELVTRAIADEKGHIVCLERGNRLTYDLPHAVRLIQSTDYNFNGYDFMKGFIAGLHSGDYDITHIFIDSVLRIFGEQYSAEAEDFFDWIDEFGEKHGVRFTLMVSADAELATERAKKYF
ncbi:MAG: hypothetical protein LBN02_07080 [Oscillospiraceae bacterium]|jgi:hypothetical protein|nr:hypothetical protein [Oscillospiraceae bacterium]